MSKKSAFFFGILSGFGCLYFAPAIMETLDMKGISRDSKIPYVQTWKQMFKKRIILTVIWVFGAAIIAGIVVIIGRFL